MNTITKTGNKRSFSTAFSPESQDTPSKKAGPAIITITLQGNGVNLEQYINTLKELAVAEAKKNKINPDITVSLSEEDTVHDAHTETKNNNDLHPNMPMTRPPHQMQNDVSDIPAITILEELHNPKDKKLLDLSNDPSELLQYMNNIKKLVADLNKVVTDLATLPVIDNLESSSESSLDSEDSLDKEIKKKDKEIDENRQRQYEAMNELIANVEKLNSSLDSTPILENEISHTINEQLYLIDKLYKYLTIYVDTLEKITFIKNNSEFTDFNVQVNTLKTLNQKLGELYITSLEDYCLKSKEAYNEVVDEFNEVVNENDELVDENDELVDENDELKNKFDKLVDEFNEVNKENDQLFDRNNKLVYENSKLADKDNKALIENNRLKCKFNPLMKFNKKLKEHLYNLEDKIDKLEGDDYKELEDNLDLLNRKRRELSKKIDNLNSMMNKLEKSYKELIEDDQASEALKLSMQSNLSTNQESLSKDLQSINEEFSNLQKEIIQIQTQLDDIDHSDNQEVSDDESMAVENPQPCQDIILDSNLSSPTDEHSVDPNSSLQRGQVDLQHDR